MVIHVITYQNIDDKLAELQLTFTDEDVWRGVSAQMKEHGFHEAVIYEHLVTETVNPEHIAEMCAEELKEAARWRDDEAAANA